MNVLALETNALKARVQTSAPHSSTCSYKRFSSRTCHEIATHRHSLSKTGGSHAPVLTCEYATPTFKLTKLIANRKTINELLLNLYYTRSVSKVWHDYTCHARNN